MKVTQIAQLTNDITKSMIGEEAIQTEDLSNVVDVGKQIRNTPDWFDNFSKKLLDQIGRFVVLNREYEPKNYGIYRDSFTYGSIREAVHIEWPEAENNPAWALVDRQNYSSENYYQPVVTVNLWNDSDTFQIPISIVEDQVLSAFKGPEEYAGFIGGIYTAVNSALRYRLEMLTRRCLNNLIGNVLDNANDAQCINLLALYNESHTGSTLTAATCWKDEDFDRFAAFTFSMYKDFMRDPNKMLNVQGALRFTPEDKLHFIVLSTFARAMETFMYSRTFHYEWANIEGYQTITAWQGLAGTGDGPAPLPTTPYNFEALSAINATIAKPNGASATVQRSGIVAVMFDEMGAIVGNERQKVTTAYSANGDFTSFYYKAKTGLINDLSQQCVVFYVADE